MHRVSDSVAPNAAVETARAGERARVFAVVAAAMCGLIAEASTSVRTAVDEIRQVNALVEGLVASALGPDGAAVFQKARVLSDAGGMAVLPRVQCPHRGIKRKVFLGTCSGRSRHAGLWHSSSPEIFCPANFAS